MISLLLLFVLLLLAVLLSLSIGEIWISPGKVLNALFASSDGLEVQAMIVEKMRLPRVILGIAVGGGLSLSGVILQGIYRNPLVEPYTLGVSGGASLGVALVIVLGLQLTLGSWILPVAGFGGGLLMIFLVYWLGSQKGQLKIQHMLLIGVMISFISSSAMMFLMAITSADNLQGIIFWIMGSLDEADFMLIKATFIVVLIILFISFFMVTPLNALRLGKEKAKQLGINIRSTISFLFILASLLAGICVSVAGVIGFVGLIIPHLVRLVLGPDFRILIPASFFLGGSFILFSDILARTIISPNELPIGVITGIFGGILFIILMSRKKVTIS